VTGGCWMTPLTRLAAGIAACLGPAASGVTIDWATVGNAGNPANVNGWGAVANPFQISTVETMHAQYAEFLNSVDAHGINPNGVYNSFMGSDALGGITFNAGAPSGAKYAVKAGAPPGSPAGTNYAQMPVVFVTWFSAARFTNWLQNGQQANATSMEDGTYPLHNQTSGPIPARNPDTGSQVALPSRDEWYKGAFYDGPNYLTWPCQSNQPPTNTVTDLLRPCAANVGGAATPTVGPINVGSYRNTQSPYGLFDMLGNVTEYTDTAGTGTAAGRVQVFGGSWATPPAEIGMWSSLAPPVFRSPANPTGQIGFRVVTVQAVPEPSSAALTAVAIACLAGYRCRQRWSVIRA
jgi:formylglycine-generating enzyme